MYSREVLVEKLATILEALERIPRRFSSIASPADFYASDDGVVFHMPGRHPHDDRSRQNHDPGH